MIQLDRRAVVTGLAAVAVAGVAPALPDSTAATIAPLTPRGAVLDGLWHLDMPVAGRFYLRHLNSGLAFAFTEELDEDGIPNARYIAPPDHADRSPVWQAYERAAKQIGYEAPIMRLARQHSGPIYVQYFNFKRPHKFDPIRTEDAPPWSQAVEQLQTCPWCNLTTPALAPLSDLLG